MTNIPSVEERGAEMPTNKCPVCDGDGCTVEHDPNDPTGQTPIQVPCDFCHAEGKITTLDCVTQALTADRIALLTQLRNSEMLEDAYSEKTDAELSIYQKLGHNALARKIKAHLDELIKTTSA